MIIVIGPSPVLLARLTRRLALHVHDTVKGWIYAVIRALSLPP